MNWEMLTPPVSDPPLESALCPECHGTGRAEIECCNGDNCGCKLMPPDFEPCPRGCEE